MNLVNKIRKILLLVEGAKTEVELFNKAFQEYKLDVHYEIYSYKTNIYDLYERMFLGNENDLNALDLLGVLKEKDSNNQLLREDFSDILLIFDYDPQDNRFNVARIKLMLKYFNESTDNGKLFINYPMFESFKHLKSSPDPEYKNRCVDISVVLTGKYKELVGIETRYHDLRTYDKNHFNFVIIHNINKANYIINKMFESEYEDLKNVYFNLIPENILREQNEFLLNMNKIHVLNSALFFICDYNFDLIL